MRIACIGPQNTGKTTFIKDFMRAFPQYSTPSTTYRDVIKQCKLEINQNATIEGQKLIYNSLCHQYMEDCTNDILFDRSPIDACVYTLYVVWKPYLGRFSYDVLISEREYLSILMEDMIDSAIECLHDGFIDLLLYFPLAGNSHIKSVADGVRDIDPQYRADIGSIFDTLLIKYQKELPPIWPVVGTGDLRKEWMQTKAHVFNCE